MSNSRPILFKLVCVGDSGAGKSSLVHLYCSRAAKDPAQLEPTIGVDFLSHKLRVDERDVHLQVWDTAGQERFRAISTTFFRGSSGVLIVFDVNSEESFANVSGVWAPLLCKQFGIESLSSPSATCTFALVGNKCDTPDSRVVTRERAEALAKKELGGVCYFETQTRGADNEQLLSMVDRAFGSVVRVAVKEEEVRFMVTMLADSSGRRRLAKTPQQCCEK
jgi:small GTP-binding protein